MPITIRRALPEEADCLTALSLRSKQSNGYDDAFMEACRDELTVTTADMARAQYWVAEDGEICGCACLRMDDDGASAEVGAFFIAPEHKRLGIGKLLWRALYDSAFEHGLELLRLDADPSAVPFYEHLGFRIAREVPSGSIPGRMLPHMQLSLK